MVIYVSIYILRVREEDQRACTERIMNKKKSRNQYLVKIYVSCKSLNSKICDINSSPSKHQISWFLLILF